MGSTYELRKLGFEDEVSEMVVNGLRQFDFELGNDSAKLSVSEAVKLGAVEPKEVKVEAAGPGAVVKEVADRV